MLVASDASTGELRWRVPISRPGAEEWIELTGRDSNVVVATVGSRLRLFHVTTGAPLSELIDLKDLFGNSLQNHPNIQVESSGAIHVGSQSEEVTVRRAPPDRDTYRGVLRSAPELDRYQRIRRTRQHCHPPSQSDEMTDQTLHMNKSDYDAIIIGAGISGLYQLHTPARARPEGARARGRHRRRRHLVLEPLSRRALRFGELLLRLLLLPGAAGRMALDRALLAAARDAEIPQPRRRQVRPAPRHPVQEPRGCRRTDEDTRELGRSRWRTAARIRAAS